MPQEVPRYRRDEGTGNDGSDSACCTHSCCTAHCYSRAWGDTRNSTSGSTCRRSGCGTNAGSTSARSSCSTGGDSSGSCRGGRGCVS
ncbi:MAG: hypothetical protein ISS31_06345 [Kiritimatiellae bacterium]|nr:hypothetical protein [Kiritimatiellia bacterium]